MATNIFVAGLDDFHLQQLTSLSGSEQYRFHSLMTYKEIKCGESFPVQEFLQYAQYTLSTFEGRIDAVVGFWDFPVSTVLPVIRRNFGLGGPTLESVLKCEHKYWSRQLQSEVVPEHIPRFIKINPFEKNVIEKCSLPYPFWLKPVKAVLSHLGFLIQDEESFSRSLKQIRENIERYAAPFNMILELANLPDEIRRIDGYHCIGKPSFPKATNVLLRDLFSTARWPSMEPSTPFVAVSCRQVSRATSTLRTSPAVLARMREATVRTMKRLSYDNAPFNIEFYWDQNTDKISLLEINTRISKSHCPLFKMVDGEYHHAVMLDIALGKKPDFPSRQGRFEIAAKFMVRRYEDGYVREVPDKESISRVLDKFPGTEVTISVEPGMQLSRMRDQDSYSYEIATLFMGADSEQELLRKYQIALSMLPFKIDPIKDDK